MTNTPAAIRPKPLTRTSLGAQTPPGVANRTRARPLAPATVRTPARMKFAICNHPRSPLLSALSGCRVRSKPSRVAACANDTTAQSGAATVAQASKVRVDGRTAVRSTISFVIMADASLSSVFADSSIVFCDRERERSLSHMLFDVCVCVSNRRAPQTKEEPMRYLMMSINNGQEHDAALYAEMGKFIEEMTAAGVLRATGGLEPGGTRITSVGDEFTVVDGPFAEAKEEVGGFALVEVRSKEEAIEMTRRFRRIVGDGVSVIHQVF